MEKMLICPICGKLGRLYRCIICGVPVCKNCLDDKGVCVHCKRGRRK